jgi:hypothetical protein
MTRDIWGFRGQSIFNSLTIFCCLAINIVAFIYIIFCWVTSSGHPMIAFLAGVSAALARALIAHLDTKREKVNEH